MDPVKGKNHILVVDGTGRGHAICDLFTRTNPDVTVYYGPGSDVVEQDRIIPVGRISLADPASCLTFLAAYPVEFVFVSNIDALSAGYVDVLRAHDVPVIGPTRQGAELEASKERGKRFCADHGLPVAPSAAFTDAAAAKAYIRRTPYAVVVKADGLCPYGDGAHVCSTATEAEVAVDHLRAQMGDRFRVVVEQRLYGAELSIFALLDGTDYLLFPTAIDFKRTHEGDLGKNCDGMGSISPHPADGPALRAEIKRAILEPLRRGLTRDGIEYTGFIYVGAIMSAAGLRVIEINARFGDSEAEVVLPSVHSDFAALCRAVLEGKLGSQRLTTDGFIRSSVALTQGAVDSSDAAATPGWPFGSFAAGQPVFGLASVDPAKARVFCAQIAKDADGMPVSAGGRVAHVVAKGLLLQEALADAYAQASRVRFAGMRYRTDIGASLSGGWPGRQPWWSDVHWLRLIERTAAASVPVDGGPIERALCDRGAAESILDSILQAHFAGERDACDVVEALAALTPLSDAERRGLEAAMASVYHSVSSPPPAFSPPRARQLGSQSFPPGLETLDEI